MTRKFLCMFILLASPCMALAQDRVTGRESYHFDKAHTNIMWFVSHIGFSSSMGQFMDYDGQIILDFDQPELSSVRITINTASLMTGSEKFDAKIKSAEFLDVEKYPTATFISKKVTLLEDNQAKVEGDFTLHGQTRPLTLKVRLNKRAMDIQQNIMRTGYSVKTTFRRSRWGMGHYLPFIGDNVIIRIEAEALINP